MSRRPCTNRGCDGRVRIARNSPEAFQLPTTLFVATLNGHSEQSNVTLDLRSPSYERGTNGFEIA